jgi:hypothetical protein
MEQMEAAGSTPPSRRSHPQQKVGEFPPALRILQPFTFTLCSPQRLYTRIDGHPHLFTVFSHPTPSTLGSSSTHLKMQHCPAGPRIRRIRGQSPPHANPLICSRQHAANHPEGSTPFHGLWVTLRPLEFPPWETLLLGACLYGEWLPC